MKKTTLCMMMGVAVLATSCLSEDHDLAPAEVQDSVQKGKIVINVDAATEFAQQQTRALVEADYEVTANYTVQMYDNADPSKLIVNCKYSELSSPEVAKKLSKLDPATYTVKAFYGTDVPYSRDKFYVIGERQVTLNAGDEVNVPLTCKPTCGRLNVVFGSKMADYYDYYDVSFSEAVAFGGSSISWSATDKDPWYVRLNEAGETLRYTISVTAKDEYAYTDAQGNKQNTGVVTNTFFLERSKAYKLNVNPVYNPTEEGGLAISIEFDEDTNDPTPIDVVVPIDWLQ